MDKRPAGGRWGTKLPLLVVLALPVLLGLGVGGACRDAPLGSPELATTSRALTATGPAFVDVTWMSIANVYYQLGALRIVTDGYFTRLPQSEFYGGGGGLAHTHDFLTPDGAAVARVRDALGGASAVNLLLTGHSHFDHSFDTATWSSLTGAPIYGPKTTCYQAEAQKLPAGRCTSIFGGERITLADGVTMRVVRWNHSGDSTADPEQHDPVELETVPTPDPVTGGLRAGVADDFPNGGGARGLLFVVDGPQCRFAWFYENSASAADLSAAIVVDGVNYGAPLDNLKAAMTDAGLTSVDLWIATGDTAVAKLVVPVLKPKAYLPVHWDGLWRPFLSGAPSVFSDAGLETYLSQSSVALVRPHQYMDKWRLDCGGVVSMDNGVVKQALGFCTPVTTCPAGDNCGSLPNGCGGTVSCGAACPAPQTCGGGGSANVCGCTPLAACPAADNCGSLPNGCGGTVSCGVPCTAPQTCGGGGSANVCGCTPLAACPTGDSCGALPNGCGGVLACLCSGRASCFQGHCVFPDASAEHDADTLDGPVAERSDDSGNDDSGNDDSGNDDSGNDDSGDSVTGGGRGSGGSGGSTGDGGGGGGGGSSVGPGGGNGGGGTNNTAGSNGGGDAGSGGGAADTGGANAAAGAGAGVVGTAGPKTSHSGCGCHSVPPSSGASGLILAIAAITLIVGARRRRRD